MKEFKIDLTLENYQGRYVMHCPEEWQAKLFGEFRAQQHAIRGNKMDEFMHKTYNVHGKDTCYELNSSFYADLNYYKGAGYTILEISDFIKIIPRQPKLFFKKDLKTDS